MYLQGLRKNGSSGDKMNQFKRNIFIISGVLFELAALYLTGALALFLFGLEYRFWVSSLGMTICFIAIPLWLTGLGLWALWKRFQEKLLARWLAPLVCIIAAIVSLIWCFIACLLIAFLTNEDHYLGGGMISVVVDSDLSKPTSYKIYQSVGPFFRKKASLDQETVSNYLSKKYKRNFCPVETEDTTLCMDVERQEIKVGVEFVDGKLLDDYPQALADYYLLEAYQALGLGREYQYIETDTGREQFCMLLKNRAECVAFADDAYALIQYALKQESLLKKYDVCLLYATTEYEGKYGSLEFGRHKSWSSLSSWEYDSELKKVRQLIYWEYDALRLQAFYEKREKQEAVSGNQNSQAPAFSTGNPTPTPAPTPQLTDQEIAEAEFPDQCKAAEAIWGAELKDLGYEYEPNLNAKGNLVIWVGRLPADNLQSTTAESDYYLTYDRESKNGNCYLFVLSEVPEGHGLNDAYLREFYACEKATLKVVAGHKTSWGQTGTAQYRKITGE